MRTNFHLGWRPAAALLLCFLLSPSAAMSQNIGSPGITILVAPPAGGDPNRCAAALVSTGFPPQPAEMFDLPNVGGDVLAMDFADPGETRPGTDDPAPAVLTEDQTASASPSVSVSRILSERLGLPSPTAVLTEILSLVTQLLRAALTWLLWALLILAGLMCTLALLVLITAIPAVMANRTEEFVQAVAVSLGSIVNATNTLIGGVQKTIADWMSEETRTKPSWMLIGLICLVIAPAATLADYRLLNFSLEALIPPSADMLWLVAGTLTAVHAMVGLLLHTSQRRGTRALLYVLLIVSLSCESWFSFQRTIELENGVEPSAVQTPIEADSAAESGIEVNTALLSEKRPVAAGQSPAEQNQKDKLKPWWSWSAIMMALITLVCGLAEAVGWYASFHLSSKLICWVFFAPVYLPAKLMVWALSGTTDERLVNWVQVELRSVLEWPEKAPARRRDWKVNRNHQQGEVERSALQQSEKTEAAQHQLELARQARATAKTIEEFRLIYNTIDQYELHRHRLDEQKHTFQHLARLNADWRAHIEVFLKSGLLKMKELFTPIYEQAATAIAEDVKQKVSEKTTPVAEQVATAVAEKFRKHASASAAVDGNYQRYEHNEAWKAYAAKANVEANPQSSYQEEQV